MESKNGRNKVLTAYFSHSGNTRAIAEMINGSAGGDIFEIKAVKAYPEDYDAVVDEAKQELKSGVKPELRAKVADMAGYDTIFIGYPVWWYTFPAPVKTFLSEYDLSGKKVIPFCTHEGSGLGKSPVHISKLCPDAVMLDGLEIRGTAAAGAQNKVTDWLRKIKIIK
jgi:flavodoxin